MWAIKWLGKGRWTRIQQIVVVRILLDLRPGSTDRIVFSVCPETVPIHSTVLHLWIMSVRGSESCHPALAIDSLPIAR